MMAFRCSASSSDSDDDEEEVQEPQLQGRHHHRVHHSPTTRRRRAPRTPPINMSRSPKKLHRAQELRRHFPTLAPHIQAQEAQHERAVLERNYVSASMDNLNIDAARTSKSPTAASPPSSSSSSVQSAFRQRSSSVPRNFSRKSLVRSHSLRRVSTPAPRCSSPLTRKNMRSAEAVNARLRQSVRDTASMSPVQRTTRLPSSPTPVFDTPHPAKRAHVGSIAGRCFGGSVSASALPLSPTTRRRAGTVGLVAFEEEQEGHAQSGGEASQHAHTSTTSTSNISSSHKQRQPRMPQHSHSHPHLPTHHHPGSPLAAMSMVLATDEEGPYFSAARTPEPPSQQLPPRPPLLQSMSLPTTPMHDPASSASSTFDLSD